MIVYACQRQNWHSCCRPFKHRADRRCVLLTPCTPREREREMTQHARLCLIIANSIKLYIPIQRRGEYANVDVIFHIGVIMRITEWTCSRRMNKSPFIFSSFNLERTSIKFKETRRKTDSDFRSPLTFVNHYLSSARRFLGWTSLVSSSKISISVSRCSFDRPDDGQSSCCPWLTLAISLLHLFSYLSSGIVRFLSVSNPISLMNRSVGLFK